MSALAQNANSESINEYPTLSEMGITRFNEIASYSMRQDGADEDILRIHYKRAKGSLLPTSRKYRFGRAVSAVVTDSATGQLRDQHEISPFLLKAVDELDTLVSISKQAVDSKEHLLEEIEELEIQFNRRISNLRKHIKSL